MTISYKEYHMEMPMVNGPPLTIFDILQEDSKTKESWFSIPIKYEDLFYSCELNQCPGDDIIWETEGFFEGTLKHIPGAYEEYISLRALEP